jgi:hypothetical protein
MPNLDPLIGLAMTVVIVRIAALPRSIAGALTQQRQ